MLMNFTASLKTPPLRGGWGHPPSSGAVSRALKPPGTMPSTRHLPAQIPAAARAAGACASPRPILPHTTQGSSPGGSCQEKHKCVCIRDEQRAQGLFSHSPGLGNPSPAPCHGSGSASWVQPCTLRVSAQQLRDQELLQAQSQAV